MAECSGTVVIALERKYFPTGTERRGGPTATELREIRLPTPFNQIEAAMAYCHGHPLLVVVEEGLWEEGLLERGNDWYVQRVRLERSALSTPEFNGILASWKERVMAPPARASVKIQQDPSQMTVGEIVGSLKPAQFWSLIAALIALVGAAFLLGAKLLGRV